MRRAGIAFAFVFAAAVFVFVKQPPANAAVEYCPASVAVVHHFSAPNDQLYALLLSARSARSVNGTLLAQTNDGWYTVVFPETRIAEFDESLHNEYASWKHTSYLSPSVYVRFPSVVQKVTRWAVLAAQSTGDGVFHWDEKGMVTCKLTISHWPDPMFDRGGTGIVNDTPVPKALLPKMPSMVGIDAVPANVDPSASCEHPDENAVATRKITPTWPPGLGAPNHPVTIRVMVAVSRDGPPDEAWVYDPSGVSEFDRGALSAALNSTYRAGREFCFPAPGYYMYVVTFAVAR
jgi:hypothetical protein